MTSRTRRASLAVTAALACVTAAGISGCGKDSGSGDGAGAKPSTSTTRIVRTTRVDVIKGIGRGGGFDPAEIYRREAPGVVTVISVFDASSPLSLGSGGGPEAGLGSGFVISGSGEIATNAHVVTTGEGSSIKRAKEVYVRFADGNQVPARIVGDDPNADVALLRIDPSGLTLRPLALGSDHNLEVGEPVAAIGSPFGEPQSLSVGVISGLNRTIDSLTKFQISGALQTDAAINHGNSGGPLVDSRGDVLGINSQIRSTSGGGEGVGFAVPIDVARRSLDALRRGGTVPYAYVGVSSIPVFPQLAGHFKLPTKRGAWIQSITSGSPAAKAGLRAGGRSARFQAEQYKLGGDIIVAVNGKPIRLATDLGDRVTALKPGSRARLTIYRGQTRRTVTVTLGQRPLNVPGAKKP